MNITYNGLNITVTNSTVINKIIALILGQAVHKTELAPIRHGAPKTYKKKKSYHHWTAEEKQECYRLFTVENLSPKVIALKLQVTPSAVMNIISDMKKIQQ